MTFVKSIFVCVNVININQKLVIGICTQKETKNFTIIQCLENTKINISWKLYVSNVIYFQTRICVVYILIFRFW